MADERPEDAAFELRFRAAIQDQVARSVISRTSRETATNKANRLRVQADLIEQGVPIERVRGSKSDKT